MPLIRTFDRLSDLHLTSTRLFMIRMVRVVASVAAAAAIGLVSTPAHAYIDPGTGGMLLQLLLGGVAGAMVIVKLYWQRIKDGFQSVFGSRDKADQAVDHENETGN